MLRSFLSRKAFFLLSLLSSLFLTGCAVFIDAPQTTFDPRGPVAAEQQKLFMLTLWICTFILVAVVASLFYVVVRYRRRPGVNEDAIPVQSHGNPIIEISLIAFSVLLLVIIAVPTYTSTIFTYQIPPEYQEDVLEVKATGYQWWWSFEYPELDIVTANELVIPTGRAIRIHVRSADVVHSFWVPKLAGKRDMIPNRNNELWFLADEPGEYHGQCAEFCGESHANMLFRVFAKDADDFDQWVDRHQGPGKMPDGGLALEGKNLFQEKGCVQCHNVTDVAAGGILGPDLTHFGNRHTVAAAILPKTDQNIASWIRDPEAIKPGNLMTDGIKDQNLTEADIERLVAFLQSLN